MDPRTARLDRSGRLVLPASVRRELGVRDGDELVFTAGEATGEIRLMSRRAAIERAQELVRGQVRPDVNLVDELHAERRQEASRESARHAGTRRSRARRPQ